LADPSIAAPIFTYLEPRIPVRRHEHVAVLHRGDATAQGVEFLGEGLHGGHWCCCLAPGPQRKGMLTQLRQSGLDVQRHQARHTLKFPPLALGAAELLAWAAQFFAEAESAHAPAVRWLEEGMWGKTAGMSAAQYFELHSRLNFLVKQYPSVVLCRYEIGQLGISHLFSAIAVHRHLLVEGTLVRDNPFYIPAEKYLAMPAEERTQDLSKVFRDLGCNVGALLSTLAGYGKLQSQVPTHR
jgi:hypothetical protein